MNRKKKALFNSSVALLLCISMLLGTTWAWFTDSVVSTANVISTGTLKVGLYHTNAAVATQTKVTNETKDLFQVELWEPGVVAYENFTIKNEGSLWLKYQLGLNALDVNYVQNGGSQFRLSDALVAGVVSGGILDSNTDGTISREEAVGQVAEWKKLNEVLETGFLAPEGEADTVTGTPVTDTTNYGIVIWWQPTGSDNNWNVNNGKSTSDGNPLTVDLGVTLSATQYSREEDSFGSEYDGAAEFPELDLPVKVTVAVPSDGNVTTEDVTMVGRDVTATVPAGVKLADGAQALTLTVTEMEQSNANITTGATEDMVSLDVHMDGVDVSNTTPIIVDLGPVMPKYLNLGNYQLYHVENGATNPMTMVASLAELDKHNEFLYDVNTGNLTVAMATFSEVALVADTENGWKGKFDYTWYDASKDVLTIANADQLAAFGAIVGGMDPKSENVTGTKPVDDERKTVQDSFKDKTVKLIADINLGDAEAENKSDRIFYPIGYYNSEGTYERTNTAITSGLRNFEGTFDGQGHTIANFYHNTWEMKGDHDWYKPEEQYYRDGMGLFGRVYGGTVKNLTVSNFSSDGEIATTGVIAAYADGATFENISIFKCNPRVYNIGNGGIVGCVGWYAKDAGMQTTFKNITVDNSNKISALWGSYDVACGGIVGQYYPTSGQTASPKNAGIDLVNCHVSAQMDVYNDVCGNYQYYWYRYSGMIIGSIRENVTGDDGYTYPDMNGITAKKCTVHFGEWNHYYYCEFEKNGHPSYSGPDDYKFSRVPESELVRDANGNVTGCTHNHSDVEDNRAIYLPFDQLFTGYGWGVKSKGLKDFDGIEILDIVTGDHEKSVVKFEGKVSELAANKEYKLGDIFSFVDNGVELVPGALTVSVTNKDEKNPVSATVNYDTTNWDNGTITFNGVGEIIITIQDYYFCTPTSIEVTVTERQPEEKFDVVMNNGDFLHRVGNKGTVALDKLFKAKDGVTISNSGVGVAIENVKGNASGTYTTNADWARGTIQFSGTGVVKVTITDNDYCIPTELNLEVVNATNVTTYGELKEQNSVLLADITMSGGGTYRLTGNKVLYGNGFTFDVRNGAYAGVQYDYASYVVYLENSTLDNVKIVGAVYPSLGATKADDYNRAIVMTNGNCKIVNCYISNGASPIRNGGNLELVNTTLLGGVYCNMDIRNGHVILDNVTTVNQINGNDKYGTETDVVGMGIVVYQEGGTEELKITIRNNLTQYNYMSKAQADKCFTDTYSSTIAGVIFGDDFTAYQNSGWINMGIVSMNNYFEEGDLVDERTDKNGYSGTSKTVTLYGNSRDCYVYSLRPASASELAYPGYTTAGQGVIEPDVKFDFTGKNYIAKTEGSNDYCYAEGNVVYISMDEGDKKEWDPMILTATKNGNALDYTVKMGVVDYTGKAIIFDQSGEYTVTYTYTDGNNYAADGTNFEKAYSKAITIQVSVVKANAKHAEFSFGANGTAYSSKTVAVGDKTYVMPDVTATVSGKIGSKTVNGTTVYYPITEMYTSDGVTAHKGSWYACFPIFKDALQIIDYADKGTGDAVTYNQTTVTGVTQIPSTLKAVDPKTAFLYSMNATNYPPPTDPTEVKKAVCYTCNRNGLTASNTRKEENTVAEYTYTDNAGAVYYFYIGYHCAEQTNGCVTPDTLITLADGSKVRVDSLKGDELLLVWNMETGALDSAPIMFVDSEAEEAFEIIHLYFSDGTDVKVIYEHGFWDYDLNRYVYLDRNAEQYIGHTFAKQNGDALEQVKLTEVVVKTEKTTAWSPVTVGHLCYFVNDMLSMPGGVGGLFNIFDVDPDTMTYDYEALARDMEKYGLFTYEELNAIAPLSEDMFNAAGGAYLKISIGKGNMTMEELIYMINRYSIYFD